jgi:hypothetical protein
MFFKYANCGEVLSDVPGAEFHEEYDRIFAVKIHFSIESQMSLH